MSSKNSDIRPTIPLAWFGPAGADLLCSGDGWAAETFPDGWDREQADYQLLRAQAIAATRDTVRASVLVPTVPR